MELQSSQESSHTNDILSGLGDRMHVDLFQERLNCSLNDEKIEDTAGAAFERIFIAGVKAEQFYTPILAVLGFLGNCLCLVVLCGDTKHRRQSSSYYLSALAISDTGFLFNLLAVWLENFYGGVITSAFTCPVVMYLGQVTCFVSIYLTVAFTLERYIAINFPFARPRLCTTSKAKKVIIGIVSAALMLFSYVWKIAQVVEIPNKSRNINESMDISEDFSLSQLSMVRAVCTVPNQYFHISEIANYIDSAVTLIIPFALITCFNMGIAISVRRLSQERNHLVSTSQSRNTVKRKPVSHPKPNINLTHGLNGRHTQLDDKNRSQRNESSIESTEGESSVLTERKRSGRGKSPRRQPKGSVSDMRVTKMLLVVSTVFLALNVPLHAIRCGQFYQLASGNVPDPQQPDLFLAMQPWANMLFNTNFAVNFLLYCLAGSKFRRSLLDIFRKKFSRRNLGGTNSPTIVDIKSSCRAK